MNEDLGAQFEAEEASVEMPEERILLAAIRAIEEVGIERVTIRKIAELAGVNSAAINYYYRSKERLIDSVMKQTLENAFDDVGEYVPAGPLTSVEPLKVYFRHIFLGMRRYPGIVRMHLYDPLIRDDYRGESVERLNAMLQGIFERIAPAVDASRHDELRLSIIQFEAALLFTGITPRLFSRFAGGLLEGDESYIAYIDSLVDTHLGPFIVQGP